MHTVKRIEIIANSFELGKILDGLKKAGVTGHLVIRNVAGQGLRGGSEDLDMTMLDNVYVIAFCPPETLKGAVEIIRPILNKFGGSCYISDAMEIRSTRCIASL
jgi:nitrogen regulatory protein PII